MRDERIETEGIPAKLYDPGGATGLLLLGHGGGLSKDTEPFVSLGLFCAKGEAAPPFADPPSVPHRRAGFAEKVVQHRHRRRPNRGTHASAPRRSPHAAAGGRPGDGRRGRSAPSHVTLMFGAPTVAAMPSIKAAVFGVGGIPVGREGYDNTALGERLLVIASKLEHPQVLMLNMTQDEIFPVEGTHAFFDAIPGRKKRLMFWEGNHVGIPAEAIRQSIDFLNKYTA